MRGSGQKTSKLSGDEGGKHATELRSGIHDDIGPKRGRSHLWSFENLQFAIHKNH
jgi:hypothetical protein